jgi:hypothetical protein
MTINMIKDCIYFKLHYKWQIGVFLHLIMLIVMFKHVVFCCVGEEKTYIYNFYRTDHTHTFDLGVRSADAL